MNDSKLSFREFYTTGKYKGFQKVKEFSYEGITNIIFSNRRHTISKTGKKTEEVLKKVFAYIDLITVVEN